jgi:multidrug resistance efflux pump
MFHKFVLPLIAVIGFGYACFRVWEFSKAPAVSTGRDTPPVSPVLARTLAGSGIVEAQKENILIGTPVPGLVMEVKVAVKEDPELGLKRYVKKGDPLFILDTRALEAQRITLEAAHQAALRKYERLKAAPRPEDIPVYEAARNEAEKAVEEAQARLEIAQINFGRSSRLADRNAATLADYDRDRIAVTEARAALARSQSALAKANADYNRLMAGTWKEDLEIARAEVAQAEAALKAIQIEIDRYTVRAPSDGEVLRVYVRPGQYAATTWNEPMVVLGELRKLHVRIDIDEHDLAEFHPGARAWATPRGNPSQRLELSFVKVEPYVIPKRSLTGDNTERVDTRVLQVIYALPDQRDIEIYVGQQMDAYIEVKSASTGRQVDHAPQDSPGTPRAANEPQPDGTSPRSHP